MGRRIFTLTVALAVGAIVGWKFDGWIVALDRAIEADRAEDRHLAAVALVNEAEARWGPPSQWAGSFHTHLPSFELGGEGQPHP